MLNSTDNSFHGFASPAEALNYYYHHVLDRIPEGFEYSQEKRLLEWLEGLDKARKPQIDFWDLSSGEGKEHYSLNPSAANRTPPTEIGL